MLDSATMPLALSTTLIVPMRQATQAVIDDDATSAPVACHNPSQIVELVQQSESTICGFRPYKPSITAMSV
jgi:hypothetical protein